MLVTMVTAIILGLLMTSAQAQQPTLLRERRAGTGFNGAINASADPPNLCFLYLNLICFL